MRRVALAIVATAALAGAWSLGRGVVPGPADPSPSVPAGADMDHAHAAGDELQARLDDAAPGDTIALEPGEYHGNVVVRTPGVTLDGGGAATLDGMGQGSVLTIDAPGVTVRGLTIAGSGTSAVGSPSGVLVAEDAHRAKVADVRIRRSYFGVTVRRADDAVLERLDVVGSGQISGELHAVGTDEHDHADAPAAHPLFRADGVWLFEANRAVVRDSTFREVRDGVYVSYGSGAQIEGNRIVDSRYAVHDMYAGDLSITDNTMRGNLSGCVLMYGGPVSATGNVISESGSPSTGFGVLIKDAAGVYLEANVIADNRVGLHVDDAGRTAGDPTVAVRNTFAMNQVGVVLFPSADAGFGGNAFVENSTQVTIGGSGTTQAGWNHGGEGNYWSDYGGVDRDGDGRGDLPYTRSGRIGALVAGDPALAALASGPAFRLLGAVEERWVVSTAPIVLDPAPLVTAPSPAIRGGGRGSPVPTAVPGAAAVAAGVWLIARARRPRRPERSARG